jgi:hypothetical protein
MELNVSQVGTDLPIKVSYGLMCPDSCPIGWENETIGTIGKGVFMPVGSVALHYFQQQRNLDIENKSDVYQDVYFITQEDESYVKIGIAINIEKRLACLQIGNPQKLKVVGVIKRGGRSKEKQLHDQFNKYRASGEWFRFEKPIKEII